MKRIAIVAHGLGNGGAERVAALLANQLVFAGNKVLFIAVYSFKRDYELDEQIKYSYISGDKNNRLSRMLIRAKKIENEINKFQTEVTISFIINEMIFCNLKKTTPIIYSLRNDPATVTKKIFRRYLCLFSYSRAYKIVFQTSGAKNKFPSNIRDKSVIIGNPLTPNLPYWKCYKHEKKIITACRLVKQKNLKMLITAFAKLHLKYPDYILEIYGKGELQIELEEYSKSLGIKDYVFFPGYTDDIHKIMAKSSIFSLTSDFEGLSNSMLEALAIGVPTICTDCPPGGAAEYISNNINGLLVAVKDVEALYEGLCRMVEDNKMCEKMSEEAVKIREKLEISQIMKQWLSLFDEC